MSHVSQNQGGRTMRQRTDLDEGDLSPVGIFRRRGLRPRQGNGRDGTVIPYDAGKEGGQTFHPDGAWLSDWKA